MAVDPEAARARAELKFAKTQEAERVRDEAAARTYAESMAFDQKTARLKALRLARDAEVAATVKKLKPKPKPKTAAGKAAASKTAAGKTASKTAKIKASAGKAPAKKPLKATA